MFLMEKVVDYFNSILIESNNLKMFGIIMDDNHEKYRKKISKYWKNYEDLNIYKYWKENNIIIPRGKDYYHHIIAIHFFNLLKNYEIVTDEDVNNIYKAICEDNDQFKNVSFYKFLEIINSNNDNTIKTVSIGFHPDTIVDSKEMDIINHNIEIIKNLYGIANHKQGKRCKSFCTICLNKNNKSLF